MSKTLRKQIGPFEVQAHPVVFPAAAILIVLFVVMASARPQFTLMKFLELQSWITANGSWLYIASMTGFLIFAVYLALSRYGSIRLGPDDEGPEFHTLSWFAMLFSAGMGIGMLFWGVAEPLFHYANPLHAEGETLAAARESMALSNFHWGFHPWALYSLVALSLAYFGFRRGLPLSFRSVFYPLLGDRIHGRLGDLIDIAAVLATLFGLATSLGLGAKQVNAGLNFVFGWPPQATGVQVVIIACITAMAVASLVSGLHVGIKWLSNINMCIAAFLLVFLFVTGPTVFLLSGVVENTGAYLQHLPENAFWTATYGEQSRTWFGAWTVFYWGWWIAWSPFVGMFIARISRGRTIREFITGVLIVPTVIAIIWMSGFGGSALHQEIYERASPRPAEAVDPDRYHPSSLVAGIGYAIAGIGPRSWERWWAETAGELYGYEAKAERIQKTDPETGLAIPDRSFADGDWRVMNLSSVATPTGVLVRPHPEGGYETRDGGHVKKYSPGALYDHVLVQAKTLEAGAPEPYHPTPEAIYTGPYASEEKRVTPLGFLTSDVLSRDRTGTLDTTATVMFVMLRAFPLAELTALLGTVSVILFFVTSSDSASMVADIIASGGSATPSTGTRLFWGILEGILAAVLLMAGGLVALQTGSITLGLPFCLVIIAMCFSLGQGLKREMAGDIPAKQMAHAQGDGDRSAE